MLYGRLLTEHSLQFLGQVRRIHKNSFGILTLEYVNERHEGYLSLSISLVLSSRIKHANIVSLEDIYENKSHLYLVMQL